MQSTYWLPIRFEYVLAWYGDTDREISVAQFFYFSLRKDKFARPIKAFVAKSVQ